MYYASLVFEENGMDAVDRVVCERTLRVLDIDSSITCLAQQIATYLKGVIKSLIKSGCWEVFF